MMLFYPWLYYLVVFFFLLLLFGANGQLPLSTGTFTIYMLVSAFTVVFVTIWVPETKGRTLEEIQFSFRWGFLSPSCILLAFFLLLEEKTKSYRFEIIPEKLCNVKRARFVIFSWHKNRLLLLLQPAVGVLLLHSLLVTIFLEVAVNSQQLSYRLLNSLN